MLRDEAGCSGGEGREENCKQKEGRCAQAPMCMWLTCGRGGGRGGWKGRLERDCDSSNIM